MKKQITALAMLCCTMAASAQFNLQMHYDMGRFTHSDSEPGRQLITLTAEYFNADQWGSTFLFIDMDHAGKGEANHGAMSAYWEIGRDFTVKAFDNSPYSITAHLEWDAGLGNTGSYQSAALVGPALQWHSADFSKTFTLQMLYKQYLKSEFNDAHASFQITPVWGITFANGLCTFSGFADLWYGYRPYKADKGLVFLSEPQLWYNIGGDKRQTQRFSIGTEWEISNEFVWGDPHRTFYVNPTLAVKYTF